MYKQQPILVDVIMPTAIRCGVTDLLYGAKPDALLRTVRPAKVTPAPVRQVGHTLAVKYLNGWCQTKGEGLEHIYFRHAVHIEYTGLEFLALLAQIPPVSPTGRKLGDPRPVPALLLPKQ